MSATLSFNNIYENEESKVGLRASDLSAVFRAKYPIPLSFVITNLVFEEFMSQNKLNINIKKILSATAFESEDSLKKAYESIKQLFAEAKIPEEYIEQLKESYEALNVGKTKDAQTLLQDKSPVVNIIISPDYALDEEKTTGFILNIRGFDNFTNSLKQCWLSLFSPLELKRRHKNKISDFKTGIIVQRFENAEAIAETTSKSIIGDYEILVEAYKGLPDITRNVKKDIYHISKEFLRIEKLESGLQEYYFEKVEKSGLLAKRHLGRAGLERKITDKQATEAARITKRLSTILKEPFRGFFFIKGETIIIFLTNRKKQTLHEETKKTEEKAEEHLETEETVDSGFFKDIINDLEPQIEQEIRRRYEIAFGSGPENVEKAIRELNENNRLPEKEQIFKLKEIEKSIEKGEEVDLDFFMKLTEEIRKFLRG